METVISETNTSGHIIQKYNFKVLSTEGTGGLPATGDDGFTPGLGQKTADEPGPLREEMPLVQEENVVSKSSKDELIESLLQKTDEMSSNFIKMQMKLEAKEEEFKAALEAAKAEVFEQGKEAGIQEAQALVQQEHSALMEQFATSVSTLEKSTNEFASSIEGIKEELIHAALDIAKEVIKVETSQRGNEIATVLAQELIAEIKGSSQVTIKVNPNDKVALEKSLGTMENIKIMSDNAVSLGGVVVLSDAGNIDGDIMKRYERVKSAALGQ